MVRNGWLTSGVFYAAAALVASLQRREVDEPDVVFELAA